MTTASQGLTAAQVQVQVQKFGFNEFAKNGLSTKIENLIRILRDPMGLMLLLLGIVYWTLGEYHDAIILLIAYVPIIGTDVLLELRSQKAMRLLKRTLKTTCFVLRDGKTVSIAIRNLVPGDLLLLEEGQTIPADGQLIESNQLTIDESSLTGESLPVEKLNGQAALSGTTVLTGNGIVEIEKIGFSSQMGSIARVLQEFNAAPSPLLKSIHRIVKIAFLIALGLAGLVFLAGILKNHGVGPSLISALTLAMAAIPEEFPLVFTLYLSMAAYRLSKKGVLVKSLPSVEGLGRVDIICTDKTGTLTEGIFHLEKILKLKNESELNQQELAALVFSCEKKMVDAMEASIFNWLKENHGLPTIEQLQLSWSLEFDYPFETKEKYMSHIWREQGSQKQMIAMKGAVEGVLKHCDVSEDEKKLIFAMADKEAGAGRRLLALAARVGEFTGNRRVDETSLKWIGLLSFGDPIRPGVKEALRLCSEQGIQSKMLTGDDLLTAHSIADQISLPHEHNRKSSTWHVEIY